MTTPADPCLTPAQAKAVEHRLSACDAVAACLHDEGELDATLDELEAASWALSGWARGSAWAGPWGAHDHDVLRACLADAVEGSTYCADPADPDYGAQLRANVRALEGAAEKLAGVVGRELQAATW